MAIESKMARGPIGRPGLSSEPKKKKPWGWLFFVALLVVVAFVGWYYLYGRARTAAEEPAIASGDYQAVFLDNGQVYFGKLQRSREDFYLLTDVFYLQSGVAVDQATSLALTKLGSEAHGPEDQMQINKEHVLFIEDMKDDSKVVQAIQQYISTKK
ncbi:MAG: hypothetical protein AAB413_00585 [Patescibacteria group bacterium]